MSENPTPEFDPEVAEFAENPEPRCPCVLLLDTSGSMSGSPIQELNEGLVAFRSSLQSDSLASLRVEVMILTFGGKVVVQQDFVTAGELRPLTLEAHGSTPMGEAIHTALTKLEERKAVYKRAGAPYYRPWVFLLTDGEPTDEWKPAADRVHEAEEHKGVAFFAVGVEKANMKILAQIAPESRPPKSLKGLDFKGMFVWLSQSLTSVSHSKIGEQVPLKPADGWSYI
jgi:uncharacterized protein YegL